MRQQAQRNIRMMSLPLMAATVCMAFPQSASAQQTLSCIHIDSVALKDANLLTAEDKRDIVAQYENKCIGLGAFNEIMEATTSNYIDRGYITSRAYLPEQNLADGSLEIAVVEGVIDRVTFNGKPDPKWQRMVYPHLEGEVAQIREIEQGLDNIREMETYQAEMEIEPGEDVGASTLNIKATTDKPWKINYSTNNFGSEALGKYSSTVGVSYDHLFGINDQWDISYTQSVSPNPLSFGYDGQGSHAASIGVVVPYGKWEHSASYSWSRYDQEIPGTFDPIPIDGWSETYELGTKRLMHRDQVSKTYLAFTLNRARNMNYILDTPIDSSSRILTTARLELSHERPMWGGNVSGTFGIEQDLKLFGAEDADKQVDGLPDAQYTLIDFSGSYDRKWQKESGTLGYEATMRGQLSADRLYGGQQFGIGGVGTVRGVMSGVASGSSGIFLRQEASYSFDKAKTKYLGTPEFYVGLDHGRVFGQPDLDTEFWQATGAAVGIKLAGGLVDIDASYGKLLCAGCQGDLDTYQPSGEWMITMTREF